MPAPTTAWTARSNATSAWTINAPPTSASTTTGPGEIFIRDTFGGAVASALSDHTGEIGATWRELSAGYGSDGTGQLRLTGTGYIYGDGADPNGTSLYYASGVPPSTDYQISAVLRRSSTSWHTDLGLRGRSSITSNERGYVAYYSSPTPRFELYANRGTGYALLSVHTQTLEQARDYTVMLRMRGNDITVLLDGTAIISVTTNAVMDAGRAGLHMYNNVPDSIDTGIHFGAFIAETLESIVTTLTTIPTWSTRTPSTTTWSTV